MSRNSNRKKLQRDAITGFLGFFAFLAVIQAAINVVAPEPKVWPAVLALILVFATVAVYRANKNRD